MPRTTEKTLPLFVFSSKAREARDAVERRLQPLDALPLSECSLLITFYEESSQKITQNAEGLVKRTKITWTTVGTYE